MTPEEMQRTMEFIVEQQAQFAANMGQVQTSIAELTGNVGQVQAGIAQLTEAQRRTDATVERLASQVEHIARQQVHINGVVGVIADSQQHTDERLNSLITLFERHISENHKA